MKFLYITRIFKHYKAPQRDKKVENLKYLLTYGNINILY